MVCVTYREDCPMERAISRALSDGLQGWQWFYLGPLQWALGKAVANPTATEVGAGDQRVKVFGFNLGL